ncbi:MAG: nucleotidyltransferase family protein [Deltaproteobacteria bacterium]|nr:nucleotidyltransferase family protein [Deltaproteobacteria bacterium]
MIAVILAAGQGRRLGGVAKALLAHGPGGPTFLETIWARARAAGANQAVVVVGEPFADSVAAESERIGLEVAVNPAPERGMSSSVAVGFARAVELDAVGPALLWPVDHAFVAPATVARLAGGLGDCDAVIPTHLGRGGHPVVVHRRLWPELCRCAELPEGARSVLRARGRRLVRIETDAAVLRDVDRPADLRTLVGGLA